MRSWYFTEQSYHPAWPKVVGDIRIDPPSSLMDPHEASVLLNQYIDEWMLADELGLDLMVNEHHASMSCMSVSCTLTLAILARQTKKARLVALGIPALNRLDPFRIAEEIAYIDVMSRGRLEVGLIKGTDYELMVSNQNAARMNERYWEFHDVVVKALTHTGGPFSWEGEHFQYRFVNVIPRCYQQPMPPMWMPTFSPSSAREIARRDYKVATFISGHGAKAIFDAYRDEYRKFHKREPSFDKFAYTGLVAVGPDSKTGMERGHKVAAFSQATDRSGQHYRNPPGFRPAADNAKLLKTGGEVSFVRHKLPNGKMMSSPPTPEEFVQAHMLFAGNPDEVFEQIKAFWEHVGGFGNMIVQMGGLMSAEESFDSIRLYAKEVQPRLADLVREREKAAA